MGQSTSSFIPKPKFCIPFDKQLSREEVSPSRSKKNKNLKKATKSQKTKIPDL